MPPNTASAPRSIYAHTHSAGTYGATLDALALTDVLAHVFDANALAATFGELPTPVCVWGPHGIGKTALVREVARARGWGFVEIAPAQIEELGDLHGLPTRVDSGTGAARDGRTAFLPPEWVPQQKGPGILLLDDLTRADERVLRALMQLLQNHRLYSWALPDGWQIVCTANPESGDYNVTAMDDALLTRMLHFTLRFDVAAWARWARDVRIDPRCIEFVTSYPEAAVGRRTTPRTLAQFFRLVAPIKDFGASGDRIAQLAHAALDSGTAAAFVRFACEELRALPTATQLLDADTTALALTYLINAVRDAKDPTHLRIDRLGTVISRLEDAIDAEGYAPGKRHAANLTAILASPELPRDLAMRLHRTLSRRHLGALVRDRVVAKRLLGQAAL
ncbi:MAG: AAA family ATPase [Deltaproteobacteria bacterium]